MTKLNITIFAFALTACAGAPPPKEHLATSMAAVKTAESAGASNEPEAAKHLKLAKDEIGQAQKMIAEEENEHADRMTMRASNDAELALALAREAQIKRELSTFAAAHPELKTSATASETPSSAPSKPSGAGAPQPSPATPGK
jgi:Domain of unknown function (DUF4398)